MILFERMRADIERRVKVLPQEVEKWNKLAKNDAADPDKDIGKMGIHLSQLQALKILMDGLQARQDSALESLRSDMPPTQFASAYLTLTDEVVSAHELWRIFRYIISLHKDSTIGPLIDAADLIAADCYQTCMDRARDWNLVTEEEFRAPPLVYFEAEMTPSTASRGYAAGSLGFPLRRYRDLRLPIPLILFPSDNATSIWTYCTVHHEVGHNLDQDLNLKAEIAQHLLTRLDEEHIASDRQKLWCFKWTSEIIADAFGVLLGGTGFAQALAWWMLVLAPENRYQELNAGDAHPAFYVRAYLLASMLRCCNVPQWATTAEAITQALDQHQKPDWIGEFTADTSAVAEVVFKHPLAALAGHSLSELVPGLEIDAKRAQALADYLLSGISRPDPKLQTSARWRLVPVAAQMAFTSTEAIDDALLGTIHDRAMAYLVALKRPGMMHQPARTEFYRKLVRELSLA